MYCTLVLVWATLAALAVPALWPFYSGSRYAMILTVLAFCILAVASYRASVASARGYVSSLRASDEEVAEKRTIKAVGVDQAPT
jgi:membrane protein implicated in regulation of membrane protease activity